MFHTHTHTHTQTNLFTQHPPQSHTPPSLQTSHNTLLNLLTHTHTTPHHTTFLTYILQHPPYPHTHCTTPHHTTQHHTTLLTYTLQHPSYTSFLPTTHAHIVITIRHDAVLFTHTSTNITYVHSRSTHHTYKHTYINAIAFIRPTHTYMHMRTHTLIPKQICYISINYDFNAVHVRRLSRPLSCSVLPLTPHPLSCTVSSSTPVFPCPTTPLPLYVSAPPHRPSRQHRLRLR